ncbi:MAG: type IV pilus twitching motility protein PilT [Candidatus Omnitrophota bacterium]
MRDDLKAILSDMLEKNASDLHISAETALHYRIDGGLVEVDSKVLSGEETKELTYGLMTDEQIKKFEDKKEIDFSFEIKEFGRYRVNVFFQRGKVGCAIRLIPFEIMSLEECGLPVEITRKLCMAQRGLVLVTGATGSGKSTTLAAMIDEINRTRNCHIVTVEDPIEFVHKNKKAIIDQRQVIEDTVSFSNALRHVLRQDPDVVLIGEMRDLDSIEQATIIADTGHLVLATLHTSDCMQTINRMVDVFPSHQQKQIRAQLSFALVGIISQQLIPREGGTGRVLASEIMIATPAVRSTIRDGKEHQIYSIIQTSQKFGMRTMNQSLSELVSDGIIAREEAIARSNDVEELLKMMV